MSRRKSHLNVARACSSSSSSSSCCYCKPCPVKSWQTGLHSSVRHYCLTRRQLLMKALVKIFFCNLTSWFHFWNKRLEKPHVRLFYYELSVCGAQPCSTPARWAEQPWWHQLESAAAYPWLCKPQQGGRAMFKPGRQAKEVRAGSGTRPGKSQPGGDFSQLFSLQSCPRLQHWPWTRAPNALEQGWRVCWCSNTPDTVKTKMQLYLLGHAKYLQENLKPA